MQRSIFSPIKNEKIPETREKMLDYLSKLTPQSESRLAKLINHLLATFSSLNKNLFRDDLLDARLRCHVLRESLLETQSKVGTDIENKADREIAISVRKQEIDILLEIINKIENFPGMDEGYKPPLAPLFSRT